MYDPKPTGLDGKFQDEWNKIREKQVKSRIEGTSRESIVNYMLTLKKAIDDVGATPLNKPNKSVEFTIVYGSYDRTDKGDDEKSEADEWFGTQVRRIGGNGDPRLLVNKHAYNENVIMVRHGWRETGVIKFEDGSMEVIDPSKGFAYNADTMGAIKSIQTIDTIYCVLMRNVEGKPYPTKAYLEQTFGKK